MEQDITGEYPPLKYLGDSLDLALGYKQHLHNTKMKTHNNLLRKLFKMGRKCKYTQNNSIGIKLLCVRIRSTCLGEITSRPENKYGTKQCMQSRHMIPETHQYRRSVFASWNCATEHQERCMCWNGKDQTGNQ